MPNKATVFRWLKANDDFCDQYARAREAQADSHVDDMIDIADGRRSVVEGNDPDVQRDRLAVDTRKWIASKLRPKVYGDKTILSGDPDNPIKTEEMNPSEAARRIAFVLTSGAKASE